MRVFMSYDEIAVIREYYNAAKRGGQYSQPRGQWAPCVRCGVAQWWTYGPYDHGTC